tara:strand:- start:1670 stop:1975 length:306 start_codon:yes stop_codon:yes gene_type:complete
MDDDEVLPIPISLSMMMQILSRVNGSVAAQTQGEYAGGLTPQQFGELVGKSLITYLESFYCCKPCFEQDRIDFIQGLNNPVPFEPRDVKKCQTKTTSKLLH